MHVVTVALVGCFFAGTALAQRQDGQFWPCNPIKNDTGACNPNPGLPTSTYSVDFTKETAIPANWTISNYATVNFGPLGAEFTYAKRYDAPQLWTDFFILFGKVTIEARVANGTGMISSAVLMSDDFDEIDFEFSGNNFGDTASTGKGQNNYFGKGITGNYDRDGWFNVDDPQGSFHTYTIDWSPERLVWEVDGVVVRTFRVGDSSTKKGSAYQYPQTPSKFQLGIWAGGDPGQNSGTKAWAGGTTNISAAPYTMYIKSVKIENATPAWAYNWTDQSGTWQSIEVLQQPVANVSNSTITPPSMEMNSTDPSSDGTEDPEDDLDAGSGGSLSLPSASDQGTTASSSKSSSGSSTYISTSKPVSNSTPVKSSSTPTSAKPPSTTTSKSNPPSPSSKPSSSPTAKTSSTKPVTSKPPSSSNKTTSTTSKKPSTSTSKMTTTKPKNTTTSCTTTSTKPKTISTTKASQQWQWGGWGSWWRGDEHPYDDGYWGWDWQQRQRGWW